MLEIKAPGMPDMLVSLYDQYKLLEPYRPWEGEPDNAEWVDADTGLHGRITRNTITHTLCGYVGVTSGELMGVDYNDLVMNWCVDTLAHPSLRITTSPLVLNVITGVLYKTNSTSSPFMRIL